MWNRVVDMKNVEVKTGHDFCHLCRQNEIVGRVLEEGIREHFDFVKVDVVGHGQSNGKRVAYEVNVMTSSRQFLSEFGRNHSTTTISRITGDPDLHISIT